VPGGFRTGAGGGPMDVDPLADRRDHPVAVDDELGTFHRYRTPAAAAVRGSQFRPQAFETDHLALFADNANRHAQVRNLDALGEGVFDFFRIGRHFFTAASIDDFDRRCAQPQCHPGRIQGHIAAADHHYALTRRPTTAQVDFTQEIHRIDHPGQIGLPGDTGGHSQMRPDTQKYGFIALLPQAFQREIAAEPLSGFHLNAALQHMIDFLV